MPTYVRSSGTWLSVSGSTSAGTDINSIGAANRVLYKNSLNVATGSNNLTFDGSIFSAYRASIGPYAGSTSAVAPAGLEIKNAFGTGEGNVAAMSFHCQGYYATHMHLRADSYFGIGGWSASPWRWYVQTSTGNMTAAGAVTALSDIRLKENIDPLENCLSKIMKLNGVSFNWKDLPDIVGQPGKRDYGIIAQEVEKVFPEAIHDSPHESPDGDTYKTVAYEKLIPVLLEAIKEQNEIITNLKKDVDELKNKCYDKN
jgi:hypothetical protein